MAKRYNRPIQDWADKIDWKHRVKAVCKPCWELKYCPYGPLVEEFPLRDERDERSCRIFGHDCPVFSVAEPLTETREIRNISRTIPRPMQFRVVKRDNQICSVCGMPVLDGDIHFDHIIPWSKGGPTEEHNIRLLCDKCNRKRGANFEKEYLIDSIQDHFMDPVGVSFVRMMLQFVNDVQQWREAKGRLPNGSDVAKITGQRRKTVFEDRMAQVFADFDTLFTGQPPAELNQKTFKALADRWGFTDAKVHKLSKVASKHGVDAESLVSADMDLVRRFGWPVKSTPSERAKWMRT